MEVKQELKKAYSEQYIKEDAKWRMLGAKNKVNNIVSLTKGNIYTKIIEVGAGEGSLLETLSKKNIAKEIYALEISESGIERIKERKIANLVEVKLFDGYTIPYPDNYFDMLICSHVIEHVEHPRILLRELKRISKQQILEVPIDFSFTVDKKSKHFLDYGHINIYNPALFRFLLYSENFKIINDKNSMFPLKSLIYGDTSILNKSLKTTKWLLMKLFKPLQKIKPNTYTVLTE